MSLFYDPPMKIYKAQYGGGSTEGQSHYYPGRCPVPFMFYKVDAETGCGLPGACFALQQDGVTIASGKSDASGAVCFPSLYPGTYTLYEAVSPEGYASAGRTFEVVVDKSGNICVDTVPVQMFRVENSKTPVVSGHVTINKSDVRTGKSLVGAVFELTSCKSGTSIRCETDKAGSLTFSKIPPGAYSLREVRPPKGYMPNDKTYAVEVRGDGRVFIDGYPRTTVSIENDPVVYSIFFRKLDAKTHRPLGGAVFELLQNGSRVATTVTDSAGRVFFPNVPAGNYTIREQTPPAGYRPNGKTYAAAVSPDGNVTIDGVPAQQFTVFNVRQEELHIHKADAQTGAPLEDAVLELQNGNDGVPAENFTVPHTSQATAGVYVREINVDKYSLPGALLELFKNGASVQPETAGADGIAQWPGVPAGIYTLVETQPSAGVAPNPTEYTVVVADDGTVTIDGRQANTVTTVDDPVFYPLIIHNSDAQTGEPVTGGFIYLCHTSGSIAAGASADSNGNINFGSFQPGSYMLREQRPPEGYEPTAETPQVEITPDGTITVDGVPVEQFTLANTRSTGLQVRKVNPDSDPLAGAVFELRQNGLAVQTVTSGVNGIAAFGRPQTGSYTLVETQPPTGYRSDTTVHAVTVEDDGTITMDGTAENTLTVQNLPLLYEVSFKKIDAQTGAMLPDAEYELLSDTTVITSAISDANGVVNFGSFPQGTYTIRESSPPSGYRPMTETYSVVVTADGSVTINGLPAQEFRSETEVSERAALQ